MDISAFRALVQGIKRRESSADKLNIIGSCLRGAEYISAEQTAELVRMMTSDEDQLAVAKMCADQSTSPRAYYQTTVGNSLRSDGMKEQFQQFMATQ